MTTISTDVATAKPTRLGGYLRNKPVSAGQLTEQDWGDLASFLMDLPFEIWNLEDLENLDRILDDIEFAGRVELNEGIYRTHKSSSGKRAYARKWYARNRGKLSANRRALKTNITAQANDKKRVRLKKQRKNVKGKPLKKYPTAKGHSNESRVTFAKTVKPITDSKKYSVLAEYNNCEKPRFFIPEKPFVINNIEMSAGQKLVLIGSELFFEIDGKRLKIDNPVPVIPYLQEIK
jgi:hypothetical protein